MSWILWAILWLITFSALLYTMRRLETLHGSAWDAARADHAKCIGLISHSISGKIAADALRAAADKWDSPEEQATLTRLAQERYVPGGPSMPSIWLNREANLILHLERDERNDR